MSDEEKKAIEELKGCRDFWKEQLEKPYISEKDTEMAHKEIKHDTILLNLIEKQSKEIEELKEENNTTIVLEANRRNYDRVYNLGKIYTNKKWKDKIKAKIEEYDETLYYAKTEEGMAELKDYEYEEAKYGKKVLQSLFEKE